MIVEKPYSLNLWYSQSVSHKSHKMRNCVGGKIQTQCGRVINPKNRSARCDLEPPSTHKCRVCEPIAKKEPPPRISPCPWCHKDSEVYTNGSYVRGWVSFVQCSDYECGARGPQKQTTGCSNNEHIVEEH
jgi:hypothetical protein